MSWFLLWQLRDASSSLSTTFRGPSNRDCTEIADWSFFSFSYIIIKSIPFISFGCVVYVRPHVAVFLQFRQTLATRQTSPSCIRL